MAVQRRGPWNGGRSGPLGGLLAVAALLLSIPVAAGAQAPDAADDEPHRAADLMLPGAGSLLPGPGADRPPRLAPLPMLGSLALTAPAPTAFGTAPGLERLQQAPGTASSLLYGAPFRPGDGPVGFGAGSVDRPWVSGDAPRLDERTLDIMGVRLSPWAPRSSDEDGSSGGRR